MALGVTLASFAAPEKPDLSPAAAASFSKDTISYTRDRIGRASVRQRTQPEREALPLGNVLILLDIFAKFALLRAQTGKKIAFVMRSRRSELCCLCVEQG